MRGLTVLTIACIALALSACASRVPQSEFEGHELANSWEAAYLETWGDSGV